MVDGTRTLRDLIGEASQQLTSAGVADARRESALIWADLPGRISLGTAADTMHSVEPADEMQFLAAIERRAAGEPLAYVSGVAGFRHLLLRADRRALIPRPETEGLVDAALARVRRGVAADIGTGTGAIALALRQEGDFRQVIGTDQSAEALALAAENGALTGLAVDWRLGDLTGPLDGPIDLLVSNPPYITSAEYGTLDRSVRDYEPEMALVAGKDGLDVTRRLLVEGRGRVSPGGWIALEVDCRRASATAAIAGEAGWQDEVVLDDLFGRARYVLARQGDSL